MKSSKTELRGVDLRWVVLTVNVRGHTLAAHPVGALVAQQRLHPTRVVAVGADEPVAEVTLGGRDLHAVVIPALERRAGGGGGVALLPECVCRHTPVSSL